VVSYPQGELLVAEPELILGLGERRDVETINHGFPRCTLEENHAAALTLYTSARDALSLLIEAINSNVRIM
jgi:hypothetical protein